MPAKLRKTSLKQTGEPRLTRGRTRPGAIFPVAPPASSLPESYATTLQEIKTHLRNARVRAVLAANPVVIEAYWQTGKIILARQQEAAWGAKVIDRLAADLKEAFPDMGGLTPRNLFSMRAFAESFPDGPIVKQLVSQLPWGQIIRHPDDQPTIGLLLCRGKNKLVVEYALSGLDKSIAVSDWKTQITESLPEEFRGSLPTIAEIEAELGRELELTLPPAEDEKKVERRLSREEKKSLKKPEVLKKGTKV